MHKNNSKILKKFLYFKGRIRFHVDVFLKKQQQTKKKKTGEKKARRRMVLSFILQLITVPEHLPGFTRIGSCSRRWADD